MKPPNKSIINVSEIITVSGHPVRIPILNLPGNKKKRSVKEIQKSPGFVIAEKDHHHFMIECKYHNQAGMISAVKILLYIQTRFKDVEAA